MRQSARPLYIMHEEGIPHADMQAVMRGVITVLEVAQALSRMTPYYLGTWRDPNWRLPDGGLRPWCSADWYLAQAAQASDRPGQINADRLIQLLYGEPWQNDEPHYDVVVTRQDMYAPGVHFCIGLAITGCATVISTHRFAELPDMMRSDCIVTETMHEVGHVFGLVPETRRENVEESLGRHCTNRCIMRQGLTVPYDWIQYSSDRLRGYGFCPACTSDLRSFFCS